MGCWRSDDRLIMPTQQQLIAYIRQYKDKFPIASLKSQLVKQGVSEAEVDAAIRLAMSAPATQAPPPGKTPFPGAPGPGRPPQGTPRPGTTTQTGMPTGRTPLPGVPHAA